MSFLIKIIGHFLQETFQHLFIISTNNGQVPNLLCALH